MTKKNEQVIIGRGGYGTIYYYQNNPKIVIKESYQKCDNLQREFVNYEKSYRAFLQYTREKKVSRSQACILRPSQYKKINTKCLFKMARVVPLSGIYTWQAYLNEEDEPDLDKVFKDDDKIRGRYMGPGTLENNGFDLAKLSYGAGMLIGIVHYGAKLDGIDTELIVGKTLYGNGSDIGVGKGCRLFLIDFDKTNVWPEKEADIVEKLGWSMTAELYYPSKTNKYHSDFIRGYYEVAEHYGYKKLAEKVIREEMDY